MSDLGSHVRRAQINLCENTFYKPEPFAKNKNGLPYAYFSLKLRTNYNLCLPNSPTSLESAFLYLSVYLFVILGTPGGNQHVKSAPWQLHPTYFERAQVIIITTHADAVGHRGWILKFTSRALAQVDGNIFKCLPPSVLEK